MTGELTEKRVRRRKTGEGGGKCVYGYIAKYEGFARSSSVLDHNCSGSVPASDSMGGRMETAL